MRDTDLYQRILGLGKPWFVKRVDLQVAENRVDIWLSILARASDLVRNAGRNSPNKGKNEECFCHKILS